jgi:hypothetical protein
MRFPGSWPCERWSSFYPVLDSLVSALSGVCDHADVLTAIDASQILLSMLDRLPLPLYWGKGTLDASFVAECLRAALTSGSKHIPRGLFAVRRRGVKLPSVVV